MSASGTVSAPIFAGGIGKLVTSIYISQVLDVNGSTGVTGAISNFVGTTGTAYVISSAATYKNSVSAVSPGVPITLGCSFLSIDNGNTIVSITINNCMTDSIGPFTLFFSIIAIN